MKTFPFLIFALHMTFTTVLGECPEGCNLPITIYNDLKCKPLYESPTDCCPSSYDCSNIYQRSEQTCHFKGKLYKQDERIDDEDSRGSCKPECRCKLEHDLSGFVCPRVMDGCPEQWNLGHFLKPTCYIKYELNRCCAAGQICPPFDNNAKCEVNGKTYREGELFNHPTKKCTKCVCDKSFNGKFEAPSCQEVQCYAEIHNSNDIDNKYAPFYKSQGDCCPDKWVYPTVAGKIVRPLQKDLKPSHLQCKFKGETIALGGKYIEDDADQTDKVYCECIVPPLMTCGPEPFKKV